MRQTHGACQEQLPPCMHVCCARSSNMFARVSLPCGWHDLHVGQAQSMHVAFCPQLHRSSTFCADGTSAQDLEHICCLAAGTSSMTRTPSQRVSSPGASFSSATPRARSSRARAASASAPPTSSLEFCRRANPQACVSAQTARRQCARVFASRLAALSVHTLHDSVC